jgi:ribosome maturation factor RimP
VKTNARVEGERRIKGTLAAADDDGITIGDHTLRYDEIEKARTLFEWGPAPKPGKTKAKANSS